MATNDRFMPVAPEAVWDVLADPDGYAYWVVGSKAIRDADPELARSGLEVPPHDRLRPADAQRPHRGARGRAARAAAPAREGPAARHRAGDARDDAGGRRHACEMTENPDGPFAFLALNPLAAVFTKLRNAESLMRLEELALRRRRAMKRARSGSRPRRAAPVAPRGSTATCTPTWP